MNYLRLHSDNGFGDPAHATDGYIFIWNQPRFTESQTAGEVGAAADAGDADNFSFQVLHGIDFGSAVHGEQKLVDKVGDQYRVRSTQNRRGNRPARNSLSKLDRAAHQSLNSSGAREYVAHVHAIFFKRPGTMGENRGRLRRQDAGNGKVKNFRGCPGEKG